MAQSPDVIFNSTFSFAFYSVSPLINSILLIPFIFHLPCLIPISSVIGMFWVHTILHMDYLNNLLTGNSHPILMVPPNIFPKTLCKSCLLPI